jgi:hypothetical protein
MSNSNEGTSLASKQMNQTSSFLPNAELDRFGGGTYTSQSAEPTIRDYENVFGPSAREMKDDPQKYKRHGRWHLPDILKGPNPWLADRVDGLITDASSSPFTGTILPYKYFDNVDGKLKWNVWSFDEATASRVPYESAARTLTQTKRSFSGYAVRSGLAITLEHNFMMTPQGRQNFQNQLQQLVGSIQYSNDLDVHMALILAPSYEKHMLEKYNNYNKSPSQAYREFVDLFGFMQKNQNALDILIEEAKLRLKLWGGPMPNFMLTNSKLTFQLTMTPERTNYISQGPDGMRRLRQGPDLSSYRGISIIPSRSFSMETGQPPRDLLRRRVRVAEYYRIVADPKNDKRTFELYNEERDTFFTLTYHDLLRYANIKKEHKSLDNAHKKAMRMQQLMGPPTMGSSMHGSKKRSCSSDSKKSLKKPKPSTAVSYENPWSGVLHALHNRPEGSTLGLQADHIVAHMVDPQTVFVPFVSRLHFNQEPIQRLAISSRLNNVPLHVQDKIESSVVKYPRKDYTLATPAKLRNPLTMQECTKGTREYSETRVLLARLYSRYAAPLDYLTHHNQNTSQLAFHMTAMEKGEHLHVGEMFMQPVGAFHEPNHPSFVESMPLSGARSVHDAWILTEDLLDHVYNRPERWDVLCHIASKFQAEEGMNKCQVSLGIYDEFVQECARQHWTPNHGIAEKMGVYTWGAQDTYVGSQDYLCPTSSLGAKYHSVLGVHAPRGVVTNAYLKKLMDMENAGDHPWMQKCEGVDGTASVALVSQGLTNRLTKDAYAPYLQHLTDSVGSKRMTQQIHTVLRADTLQTRAGSKFHHGHFKDHELQGNVFVGVPMIGVKDDVSESTCKINATGAPLSDDEDDDGDDDDEHAVDSNAAGPSSWEFVIIRPNIEHYMLGIILGLSGEQLGHTLWGQTELSVYDDSMHGVWGMSYKYHERAIVFNEKNLIRLWDIAYDGYNGGKSDTYVKWTDEDDVIKFKEDTNDVTKDYRGKSMMVMAFFKQHTNPKYNEIHHEFYKPNWPSPILFYDDPHAHENPKLAAGPENQDNLSVQEFRVFHPALYGEYADYYDHMPNFKELHQMRKTASESSKDDETQVDCLAYQGTMRIKEGGMVIDTINGSGHHGVDFVGVSSVRSGKGYKMTGGISQIVRQI